LHGGTRRRSGTCGFHPSRGERGLRPVRARGDGSRGSVAWLTVPGDGSMGPSHMIINIIYIYICGSTIYHLSDDHPLKNG
jgi:hypothetical protein